MYQQPTLTVIGDAQEVVRGMADVGYDLDELRIIQGHEFQWDAEFDSTSGR
jgi:hypothetical protein